ncbi:hypothetical protein [Parablautia sp. Marseille-Q6255]|uniref:hypothetical protein n=1 Tax=Parablautia sp. Marseille-Q6255 TaxID=3039593 RepID=UPI0024BC3EC5|nr:hypothetical protein [Parablautia sp. Marseille-Q6255]
MKWHTQLYLGATVKKKKDILIQKIEEGKTTVNIYLITLSGNERNQLEIIPTWNLRFWYTRENCPCIVGLSFGWSEACGLVAQIVQEAYEKTGGTDLRSFFAIQEMKTVL